MSETVRGIVVRLLGVVNNGVHVRLLCASHRASFRIPKGIAINIDIICRSSKQSSSKRPPGTPGSGRKAGRKKRPNFPLGREDVDDLTKRSARLRTLRTQRHV